MAASAPAPNPAVARDLPKVLRIGIVQEGKIAQERIIKSAESVTMGDGPRNTFAFPGTGLGATHGLFVFQGGSYALVVPTSVTGKISWRDGIRDLEDLRNKGEMQKRGEFWALPLTTSVRGKVSLGGTTVLFQFVPAPPEPVRPVTAADFRVKVFNEDDPLFLGLLGVFNLIAVAFQLFIFLTPLPESNALDHVEDALDLLVDKKPETIEIQIVKPEIDLGKTEEKVEKVEDKKADTKTEDAAPKPKNEPSAESVQKKSILLQMLGTAGSSTSNQFASDILGDAQAQSGDLAAALDGAGKVESASSDKLGMKKGGEGGRGDAAVGITNSEGGQAGTGTAAVTVRKAKVDLSGDEDVSAEAGDAGGIRTIIKKNQGRIETCTQASLKINPEMQGRVGVGWVVNAGRVSDVKLVTNTTGDSELGSCIVRAVKGFRFDEGLTATVAEFPWVLSGQ